MYTKQDFMTSVFALDVYNRDSMPKIDLSEIIKVRTTSGDSAVIGKYVVSEASISDRGVEAGLAGALYLSKDAEYKNVISFRGTNTNDVVDDIIYGYGLGAGNPLATQAQEAMEFYKSTQNHNYDQSRTDIRENLIITGQSLGGGLAGFVAAITGNNAVIYQHMPYLEGAMAAVLYAVTTDSSIPVEDKVAEFNARIELFKKVEDSSISGEVLEGVRGISENALMSLIGITPTKYFDNNTGIVDSLLSPHHIGFAWPSSDYLWGPHSQTLMILQMYGENRGEEWKGSSDKVIKHIFDAGIGTASGADKYIGSGTAGEKMASLIAYTAVPEGVKPFGDVALPALFDDMEDLSAIKSAWGEDDPFLSEHLENLAKISVTFAGHMAVGRVNSDPDHPENATLTESERYSEDRWIGKNEKAMDGVISASESRDIFTINMSKSFWNVGFYYDNGQMNKDDLVEAVGFDPIYTYVNEKAEETDKDFVSTVLSKYGTEVFESLALAKGGEYQFATMQEHDGLGLLLNGDGGGTVFGTKGNEVMVGGSGNDELWGFSGSDILLGGGGHDVLYASGGDTVMGGAGNDSIRIGWGYYPGREHDVSRNLSDTIDGGSDEDLLSYHGHGKIVVRAAAGSHAGSVDHDGVIDSFTNVEGVQYIGFGRAEFNGNGMTRFYGSLGDDTFNIKLGDSASGGGDEYIFAGTDMVSFMSMTHGIMVRENNVVGFEDQSGSKSDILGISIIEGTEYSDSFSGKGMSDYSGNPIYFIGGVGKDIFHLYNHNIASGGSEADTFIIHLDENDNDVVTQTVRITDIEFSDRIAISFGTEQLYITGNDISSALSIKRNSYDSGYDIVETISGSSRFSEDPFNRTVGRYYERTSSYINLESPDFPMNSPWLSQYDFLEYDKSTSTGVINMKIEGYGLLKIVLDDLKKGDLGVSYKTMAENEDGERYAGIISDPANPLMGFHAQAVDFDDAKYANKVDSAYIEHVTDSVKIPVMDTKPVPVPPAVEPEVVEEPYVEPDPETDETVNGSAGSDTLVGSVNNPSSKDLLVGGKGNDDLRGGLGSDAYVFSVGDGNDVIEDAGGAQDTIYIKGLSLSYASFALSGASDLKISFATGESITVRGYFDEVSGGYGNSTLPGDRRIERIVSSDGYAVTYEDMKLEAIYSQMTDGNDVVRGFSSGSFFDDSAGNDTFRGGWGDDTYVKYAYPDTGEELYSTTIYDTGGFDVINVIGASRADISFAAGSNESDLRVIVRGAEIFTIKNGLSEDVIENIGLDDGSFIDRDEILSVTVPFTPPTSTPGQHAPSPSLTTSEENQKLYGSNSGDTFTINLPVASVFGYAGDDVINVFSSGSVRIDGGDGDDSINIYGSGSDVQYIVAGSGNDTVHAAFEKPVDVDLGDGDDFIQAGRGDDVIRAGSGNDYVITGAGNDLLDGGAGIDDVEFYGQSSVLVDLAASTVTYSGTQTRALLNFENVYGSEGDDTILGDEQDNRLTGWIGNDLIEGRGGSDWLAGGAGDDTLRGGAGWDGFNAGEGDDVIDGGADYDTAYFFDRVKADMVVTTSNGSVTISDVSGKDGDLGTDTLIGVESLSFSDGFVNMASPIILDMNGDGVHLVSKEASSAAFDFDGDGVRDRTGWMSSWDGMLVFDSNGNGLVDGASEVSFTGREGALSDLDGLRDFDTNGDGHLSDLDASFESFSVWIDADSDGVSSADEVHSLSESGILSIGLRGDAVNQTWSLGQNIVVNSGTFTTSEGSFDFVDVAFSYQGSRNTPIIHDVPQFIPRQELLPDVMEGRDASQESFPDAFHSMWDGNRMVQENMFF